jgi:hypothetical protein
MVKILSWNTLESGEGGAWSDGWGCPLEILRREGLVKAINSERGYNELVDTKSEVEKILTQQRYKRIRKTVLEEIRNSNTSSKNDDGSETIDFLLFQEITAGDFWDEPSRNPGNDDSLDDEFFEIFGSLYEKVPCQADNNETENIQETLQHVFVRRNSGWVPSSSVTLRSKALVGGCLSEFVRCEDSKTTNCLDGDPPVSLVLVNLHGKSRNMRDPDLRRQGILDLWEEIGSHFNDNNNDDGDSNHDDSSWKSRIVLCGDWNTQLSDLIEPFRDANSDGVLEPVVGLLDNATATTDYPFFSTNHEDGFLAQYDGCLFFHNPPVLGSPETSPSYLELEGTSWNITGFMPKGRDGRLSGDNPGAATIYNNFTYYRGSNDNNNNKDEGIYLNGIFLPGSMPSMGLSDHLRIYTTIHIDRNSNTNKDNNKFVGEQLPSQPQQRRPYRYADGDDSSIRSSSHEDGGTDNETGSKGLRG